VVAVTAFAACGGCGHGVGSGRGLCVVAWRYVVVVVAWRG